MNNMDIQSFLDYINIPAFILQEGSIIFINKNFRKITGYGEEIINEAFMKILHIPYNHKLNQSNLLQRLYYNQLYNELQIYSKNRKILDVKVVFSPLSYEGCEALLGQFIPKYAIGDKDVKPKKLMLLQNTINPIMLYDELGNCLDCNDATLEFFECSRNAFIKNYVDDNKEYILTFDPFLWEKGGRLKKKYHINGREKCLKLYLLPGFLQGKRILIAIGSDISKHIQFQKELYESRSDSYENTQESEGKKQQNEVELMPEYSSHHNYLLQNEDLSAIALSSICEGIILVDNQEKIVFINPLAQMLTGWIQREALGRSLHEVLKLIDDTLFISDKKSSLKKAVICGETVGLSHCTTLKGRDGTDFEISLKASPILNREKEVLGLVLIFRDISEQKAQEKALRVRAEQFRLLVEEACDIVYRIQLRPELNVEYVSPAVMDIIGYAPEEFYQNPMLIENIIEADFYEQIIKHEDKELTKTMVLKCICKNGKSTWMEMRNTPFYDIDGNIIKLQGIARDITEKQKLEEKLLQLSHHDALTGLYNRTYFEEKMNNISNIGCGIVGLIVCDVDGLKIINDTLGHSRGDELLIEMAQVIKESFRQCDIVARIGGDEFAIILSDTSQEDVEKAIERLKGNIEKYNSMEPELFLYLSIGYGVSDSSGIGILEIFKEADNKMYREKLFRSYTTHSAILKNIVKTLETRDFINEGHARRLRMLVVQLAEKLGLSQERIERLSLLAKFHDIGKVGVPEHIIHKPGPLTEKELEIIQRHCEIGYRIALSSVDLAPIAEYILKHHEWWDGQGYPLGLQGLDIPIECRIIAIADAFDTMTTPRPYRKTTSLEEAIAELKRCAGSQFDSELVEKFIDLIGEEKNKIKQLKDSF